MLTLIGGIIILGVIVVIIKIISYGFNCFNEFTVLQIATDESAGNLNAALQRKFDMIPSLLSAVEEYTKHEKSTMNEITELRSKWTGSQSQKDKVEVAGLLDSALSKLMVLQEQYPQLKANENFINLQQGINLVESEILNKRQQYNSSVREYNISIRLFPRNIIAILLGFGDRSFSHSVKLDE